MKTFRISIIFLLAVLIASELFSSTVDQQISTILNAAPQERVKLMNEFKQRLSTMSSNERASAITQMRSNMQTKKVKTELASHKQQHNQSTDIQRAQQMNQKQAGSQAKQQWHNTSQTGTQLGTGTKNKFMGNK